MELKINLTADELMNVVDAIADEGTDRGWDTDDEIFEDVLAMVDAALSAMGIEIIPAEEEEKEEEEEEDIESIIFDVDGYRTISASDARLLIACVAKVLTAQYEWLPEKVLEACIRYEAARIADVYGIEMVEGE